MFIKYKYHIVVYLKIYSSSSYLNETIFVYALLPIGFFAKIAGKYISEYICFYAQRE